MRCPFCQAPVEADDAFCMKCEAELPSADSASAQPSAPDLSVAAGTGVTPPAVPAVASGSTPNATTVTTASADGSDPAEDEEPMDEAHGWVVPFGKARLLAAEATQFHILECPHCHASSDQFMDDGTCGDCYKQAVNSLRDDFYIKVVDSDLGEVAARVAARSHLGKKHMRNEDFAEVGVVVHGDKRVSFIVVCDGVSQCTNPQQASLEASRAAAAVLRHAALDNIGGSETLLREALNAAQLAVCNVKAEPLAKPDYGPPACTITAVYVREGEAFYGWCGDSRIYSIDKVGGELKASLLTRDHTYLNWVLSCIENRQKDCDMAAQAATIVGNDVERAEKYLGLKYQAALTSGDSAGLAMLEQDINVVDGMNGIVHIKTSSLHTMEQCLGEVPEGCVFSPSFGRLKLDNNVCIFACSDGAWNDADPMDGADTSEFVDMFTASGGAALDFACATVTFASGADNNTCAVILS